MKYPPLTTRFAKWLLRLIDREDWGFRNRDRKPKYANPEWLLNLWYTNQFDKITKTYIRFISEGMITDDYWQRDTTAMTRERFTMFFAAHTKK